MKGWKEQLAIALVQKDNDANRRAWARRIVAKKIPLQDLLPLLYEEGKASTRFSWMLGGLSEIAPEVLSPCIPKLFSQRHKIKVPHFTRSLARMMWYCGIPPSIEGKAVDAMLQWLTDPSETISTKVYCIHALEAIALKYPDLVHEIKEAIRSQVNLFTPAFDRCAFKALRKLGSK